MSKKFVKTQFREERPGTDNKPYPKKHRSSTQYFQKITTSQLRKYFQVVGADAEILKLVDNHPGFFVEISYHPQPNKNYKPKTDNYKPAYIPLPEKQPDEEIPEWESEGEVELGIQINKQKIKGPENIVPIKFNELKPYQIQFLEEELKRKQKEVEEQQQKIQSQKVAEKSDSDEQIQIVKTIKYENQITQPDYKEQEQIPLVQDDDDKFKSSQSSSDNDIFGDKEPDQEKEEKGEQTQTYGRINCPNGDFSLFVFNQKINELSEVWRISNGSTELAKNSKQMDEQYYRNLSSTYPYLSFKHFKHYNYVYFEMFRNNPTISVFEEATLQRNNIPTQYPKYNNRQRKYSNNYKNKKQFK